MKVIPQAIPEVFVIEPEVFGDERGFFFESFNKRAFNQATGLDVTFVQDNCSKSAKNVLRGLHYQLPPHEQGKLIQVVVGEVFDVAVDIREGSPTLGKWVCEVLSAENKRQIWIPPGFAHGFLALSDFVEFFYKTTDYYAPKYERRTAWNDPDLAIIWPLAGEPVLSVKDAQSTRFTARGIQ